MRTNLLLLITCLISVIATGQVSKSSKLRVYIDCKGFECDESYIKSQINVVDFFNDNVAADAHVLITSQPSGGGEQYQLIFYGQNQFQTYRDTLYFNTKLNSTGVEVREQLIHFIQLGLLPMVSKTIYAETFRINMKIDTTVVPQKIPYDEWGYVVVNIGADGEYSADQNYTSSRAGGSFSFNRTTEKSRAYIGSFGSKYHSVYKYRDSSGTKEFKVNNNDYGLTHYFVVSLGRRWGFGYLGRISSNSFLNFRTKSYFKLLWELNFFPYSDVNNRSFVIRYGADVTYFKYYDSTIYNKRKETLYGHEASAAINFYQKWGSFSTGMYYRSYLKDASLNSMGANIYWNIRITGGLSFYVSATGNIVHDQVYLPKGNATEQEVLTRRRQLQSTFDYYTSFGLNLRFGSKLNNFVNPRIAGYRGFSL